MSSLLKAWGNSAWRNFSSSATLIFAIDMFLACPRLAPPVTLNWPHPPKWISSGYQVEMPMTSQTSRASVPKSDILLREMNGSVAVLTLNRPEARNSLSEGLIAELDAALREFHDDAGVRAVVIAANGPAFSAGHDL